MRGSTAKDGVAQRMLDVAVAQIEVEGMTVGLDGIRMERVIEQAGVSRASAYRRWPSREAFEAEVLVETVRRTSLVPETEGDIEALREVLQRHLPRLGEEQGRRDLVVEALRVSTTPDIRRISGSPRWLTYLSLLASYPSMAPGEVRDAVGGALLEAEQGFTARRAEIYADLASLVGYRLVPPMAGDEGFRALGSAAGSIMSGVVLRVLVDPDWLEQRQELCLFGASEPAPWSEPERHLVGLLLSHLEPDPAIEWSQARVAETLARFEQQAVALVSEAGAPLSR